MAGEINKVFICTNNKQLLGATLSQYTLERYTKTESFSVEILNTDKGSEIDRLAGKSYLRGGEVHQFSKTDLQSWTLVRFSPPELMNYQGRAVVIDPDVFSVAADVSDLFEIDMKGKAILAKPGKKEGLWASSVMLLDCGKLKHWSLKSIVDGMLAKVLDYRKLMDLEAETQLVGQLDDEWNRYDCIDDQTKFLHTTDRITQPWKTGLPVDFFRNPAKNPGPFFGFIPRQWIRQLLGRPSNSHYREHPDPRVKEFFFGHLKAAIDTGYITDEVIRNAVEIKAVREDIFEVLDNTSPA